MHSFDNILVSRILASVGSCYGISPMTTPTGADDAMASQDESELCENVGDNMEESLMLPPQDDPDLMQEVDEDETQMPMMHRANDSMLDHASAVYDAINGQPTFPNLCLNVLPTCVRNTQLK